MNNFTFYSPTEFVFGKNTEQQTGELVKKYHGTKALIVYGGGSVIRSGLLDRVKKSLEEADIAYIELGGVQPNPTDPKVYEGIELGRREKVDFLLPVGLQPESLTKVTFGISLLEKRYRKQLCASVWCSLSLPPEAKARAIRLSQK